MIIERDGVRIAFEVQGSGQPALVFVHGLAANRRTWEQQVALLSPRYATIAIDLPGHGDSYTGELPNKDEFFLDVRSVVETLGAEEVVIVGWSLGGRIACEYATNFPDETAGIVLVDHNPPQIARSQPGDDEIRGLLEEGKWSIAAPKLVESWIGGGEPDLEELRSSLLDMVQKADPRVVSEIRGGPWKHRVEYSAVSVPTLALQGGSSPIGGQSSADYLCSTIAQCEAIVFDGHGHAVHASEPVRTSRAIEAFVAAHCALDN